MAITARQCIDGSFLAEWEWLTYGRFHAAAETALLYGWGANAAYAVGLWIMARLCARPLWGGGFVVLTVFFWNIAVLLAMLGILRGDLTGVPTLQMPGYATPLVAIAGLSMAFWGIGVFRFRNTSTAYMSQWYLLASFFCFPWLFTIAQSMLFWAPVRGTVQTIVEVWFAHNLYGLWLMPVSLGTAFYLIPKVLRKPLPHYHLSILAFWMWLIFTSWSGVRLLAGGPTPVWLATLGISMNVLALLPVGIITLHYQGALKGTFAMAWRSLPLRFVIIGLLCFSLVSVLTGLSAMNAWLQASYFSEGEQVQAIYGAFSMVLFGGIYFVLPYLKQRGWPWPILVKLHFWLYTIGLVVLLTALYTGGWIQGAHLNAVDDGKPVYTFGEVLAAIQPWLNLRLMAWTALAVAHAIFALHVASMLFLPGRGAVALEPRGKFADE